jgi:hypothetical protein
MEIITRLFSPARAEAASGIFERYTSGPPPKATDLTLFLEGVKNIALGAAGAVALALIIWGIMQLMVSGGDQNKVTKAKQVITAAVVGLSIIIAAAFLTGSFVDVISGN